MRVKLSLDQICGRRPKEVGRLLRARGIDPAHPYRASITFSGVTIEQEKESDRSAANRCGAGA
jgi:hypothetical protein